MGQETSCGQGQTAFYHLQENMTHICPNYKMLIKSHSCIFTGCYFRTRNTNGDSSFPECAPSLSQALGLTGAVQDPVG